MDIMIIIIFMMLFFIMLLVGLVVIAYVIMKPFFPYISAKFGKKDIILLIGKDNRMRLVPAKYSSGIYNTSTPPYSFLHKTDRAYRLGDLQCVVCHDSWGVTLDPDFAEVIEELKAKGVTDYEELERRLSGKDEKGRKLPDEDILKHSDILRLHAFKTVDFGAFLAFAADMTPTEIRSHIDEKIAKYLEDSHKLDGDKKGGGISPIFIVVIIILAACGYFGLKSFGFM